MARMSIYVTFIHTYCIVYVVFIRKYIFEFWVERVNTDNEANRIYPIVNGLSTEKCIVTYRWCSLIVHPYMQFGGVRLGRDSPYDCGWYAISRKQKISLWYFGTMRVLTTNYCNTHTNINAMRIKVKGRNYSLLEAPRSLRICHSPHILHTRQTPAHCKLHWNGQLIACRFPPLTLDKWWWIAKECRLPFEFRLDK